MIPEWARLQCELRAEAETAAREFTAKYTRPDGTLIWRTEWPGMDGSDDPYEGFWEFPLLHLLGGSDDLLATARRQWEAITWQWTEYGQIHREFDAYYDWMHHGESSTLFWLTAMTDPGSLPERQRAVRFADLYTDKPNYDPELRLIRSPLTGSRGPRFVATAEDWSTHRAVLDNYLPPFEDIPGVTGPLCQWTDDRIYAEILARMNERMNRGDVPMNLTASSMLAHAYLATGEERFRRWVLDYHDAWAERTRDNNGVIPDNIGLDGRIGTYNEGRWWGGYYGWRWPHGARHIFEAVAVGGLAAALLDGDTGRLDLIRSQLDRQWELGRESEDGWVVPNRHFDAGWDDFVRPQSLLPIYLWQVSHEQQDLDRALRTDPSAEPTDRIAKGNGAANNEAWFAYIQGKNPDYPVEILRTNQRQLRRRLEQIRADDLTDAPTWDVHHWQDRSPLLLEGLVQLTLGAPLNLYHGGLLHTPLRYFDPARRRSGLPTDVAALVEHVAADSVTLRLVNCASDADREVIVQAGGFGEHVFTDDSGERGRITVTVAAGTEQVLRLGLRRFARRPSYDTPWLSVADLPPLLRGRAAGT